MCYDAAFFFWTCIFSFDLSLYILFLFFSLPISYSILLSVHLIPYTYTSTNSRNRLSFSTFHITHFCTEGLPSKVFFFICPLPSPPYSLCSRSTSQNHQQYLFSFLYLLLPPSSPPHLFNIRVKMLHSVTLCRIYKKKKRRKKKEARMIRWCLILAAGQVGRMLTSFQQILAASLSLLCNWLLSVVAKKKNKKSIRSIHVYTYTCRILIGNCTFSPYSLSPLFGLTIDLSLNYVLEVMGRIGVLRSTEVGEVRGGGRGGL